MAHRHDERAPVGQEPEARDLVVEIGDDHGLAARLRSQHAATKDVDESEPPAVPASASRARREP